MLNYLWAGMMLVGIMWGAVHGTLGEVTEGILNSAKEAVALSITMLGIMSFWCGILKIGEEAGLIEAMTKRMRPIIRFLFPRLPEEHPAAEAISTNMIANILGLGWAATPAGLKAMGELEKLEEERRKFQVHSVARGTANDEMCTFLIINISSLQLIPVIIFFTFSPSSSNECTSSKESLYCIIWLIWVPASILPTISS